MNDVRYVVSRFCTYVWYVGVWFVSMGEYMFGGVWVCAFCRSYCVYTHCVGGVGYDPVGVSVSVVF